ncbi:MAG TPA: hypothetical protein VI197_15705 [Polyangiaceae bacterium]
MKNANAPGQVTGISQDDQSKCEYKARPDREVRETTGPGSFTPNIRRVYAILGTGEERRRILLCREVDTNLDGTKDVVRTYNDKGEKLNELSDSDFDGKIDTWVTFSGGHIAKIELDKRASGKPTEWRFYVGGKLSRVQRDTNKDGKPDVWEVYAKGTLQRMGVDLDGDGRVDRWDRDEVLARAEQDEEESEEKSSDAPPAPPPSDAPASEPPASGAPASEAPAPQPSAGAAAAPAGASN